MSTARQDREGAGARAFLEGSAVPVLPTTISAADPEFTANREHMASLVEGLQAALRVVRHPWASTTLVTARNCW